MSTLVNEVMDELAGWSTIGDIWLHNSEHVHSGLVHLDENSVMDLSETQKSEDLSWLWSESNDTTDTNNKNNLCLWLNKKVSCILCYSLLPNQIPLLPKKWLSTNEVFFINLFWLQYKNIFP